MKKPTKKAKKRKKQYSAFENCIKNQKMNGTYYTPMGLIARNLVKEVFG